MRPHDVHALIAPAIFFAIAVLAPRPVLAGDQPQWGERYTRNQVSTETGLPDSVDPATGKGIKWSFKLDTHSTPIVAQGHVFVGTNNSSPMDPRHKGDRGVLLCLDEKTGKMQWQLVVPKIGGDPYLDWPKAGMISPPTVEGDRVYVLTNRAEVVCLNINGMANGNTGPFMDEAQHQTPKGQALIPVGPTDADIIWITDLPSQVGMYNHDTAFGSVLIHGDFIYINSCNGVDNTHRKIRKPDSPSLVVLDKKTGRVVARDAEHIGPRVFHCTWSSPALGEVNGKPLVFFGGGDGVLYAFEALKEGPPEGKVLDLKRVFKFDPDPTAPKEDVHRFVGNRKESPSNFLATPVFHDGRLYITAGGDIWWGKEQAWLKCIDPSKEGDVTATVALWSFPMRGACSTPAVSGDLLYTAEGGGRMVHCLEVATGKEVWSHKVNGDIWSSPLVADGKVYVGTLRGEFLIFENSKTKKLLCMANLGAPITGCPTAADGMIFLTTDQKVFAIGK